MDMFHTIGFLACIAAEVAFKLTGHNDPTSSQAMYQLAALLAGSQIRATMGGAAK